MAVSGLVAFAAGAMGFERGGVSPAASPAEIVAFLAQNGRTQLTQSLFFVVRAGALL